MISNNPNPLVAEVSSPAESVMLVECYPISFLTGLRASFASLLLSGKSVVMVEPLSKLRSTIKVDEQMEKIKFSRKPITVDEKEIPQWGTLDATRAIQKGCGFLRQ